jgi:phage-related protein
MWTVEFADEKVFVELSAQPADVRAHFEWLVGVIGSRGLERVHEPYVKHLQGQLWEMRLKGKDGIARALYVTRVQRRVVVVRVFTKKSEKTPRREIELALKRAKDLK